MPKETRREMMERIQAEVQAEIAASPILSKRPEPIPSDSELDNRRRRLPPMPNDDGLWIKYGSKEPEDDSDYPQA